MCLKDFMLSSVLVVLMSCVCLWGEGGGEVRAKDTSTAICAGLVV